MVKPVEADKPILSQGKLTIEQRRRLFVEAYLSNGGNATQAALAAGYSQKSAPKQGYRLSNNARVRDLIEERSAEILARAQEATQLTIERVLRSLAQAIFFDPRKLYHEDGSLKHPTELDEDTAQALTSIEVFEEYEGRGDQRRQVGQTKKVKWVDKNAARDQAMRHLGAFERDNRQAGEGAVQAASGLTVALDFDAVRRRLGKLKT